MWMFYPLRYTTLSKLTFCRGNEGFQPRATTAVIGLFIHRFLRFLSEHKKPHRQTGCQKDQENRNCHSCRSSWSEKARWTGWTRSWRLVLWRRVFRRRWCGVRGRRRSLQANLITSITVTKHTVIITQEKQFLKLTPSLPVTGHQLQSISLSWWLIS